MTNKITIIDSNQLINQQLFQPYSLGHIPFGYKRHWLLQQPAPVVHASADLREYWKSDSFDTGDVLIQKSMSSIPGANTIHLITSFFAEGGKGSSIYYIKKCHGTPAYPPEKAQQMCILDDVAIVVPHGLKELVQPDRSI